MIWLDVLPTLTLPNPMSSLLKEPPIVLRTFIIATVAVTIVVYGLMPRLQQLRARLIVAQPAQ